MNTKSEVLHLSEAFSSSPEIFCKNFQAVVVLTLPVMCIWEIYIKVKINKFLFSHFVVSQKVL